MVPTAPTAWEAQRMPRTPVRISFSALLRVRDDDRYVLFHSPTRPGVCGPPGGVVKYLPPAAGLLERLGFDEELTPPHVEVARTDLRGVLPARSVRGFLAWFATGAYREHAEDCLRRELAEEAGEVGIGPLAENPHDLRFSHVRTVVEGPAPVPGKPYRQLRRFEVHDLVTGDGAGLRVARALARAGRAADQPDVVCASRSDIRHGRLGRLLIAPQSAFLMGGTRLAPDLPPVR
ncbi:hypothetical protein AB0I60_03260 [Actinosynnema sp. NPDC050436]|uniref:SMODS-associated NUDIX domain-containing protein n=1 Tax=Actinosynnema sp. NPDC050436 TaxID=3155659 RepID=UPI0033FBBB2A